MAVLGVTRSSQSHLLAQVDRLGTNLLTAVNGQDSAGVEYILPTTATPMIRQLPDVLAVAPTAQVHDVNVYRNDHVPAGLTGGRRRGGRTLSSPARVPGPTDRRPTHHLIAGS